MRHRNTGLERRSTIGSLVRLYITLPFTGVFNMVEWLPQRCRDATLWSPLVTNIYMLRADIFSNDITPYYYPMYSVWWSLALTAIGLPLVQYARKYVTFS